MLPANVAAIGTIAIQIVGVFSSVFVLGEPIGPRELIALAFIVMALASVLVRPNR